jgi:hypothetical protein
LEDLKITFAPEGKAYIVSGEWDLLGTDAGAAMTVPGACLACNGHKIPFRFKVAA